MRTHRCTTPAQMCSEKHLRCFGTTRWCGSSCLADTLQWIFTMLGLEFGRRAVFVCHQLKLLRAHPLLLAHQPLPPP